MAIISIVVFDDGDTDRKEHATESEARGYVDNIMAGGSATEWFIISGTIIDTAMVDPDG